MKVVYTSNGATVGDGLRVTRVAQDGQKLEVLVDDKQEEFAEIGLQADPPAKDELDQTASQTPATPANQVYRSYRLSDTLIAVEIPDGEIVIQPELIVGRRDDVEVSRDPNDRAGGAGTLNGVEGNFSGDKNTARPVTFRAWPFLRDVNPAFDLGTDGLSQADDPQNWRVNSSAPVRVWRRSVPTKTRRTDPTNFVNERAHSVFLELASPLGNITTLDIEIPGVGLKTLALGDYNPLIRTPSHYIEAGPQIAYVGQWLGVDNTGEALTTDAVLSENLTWALIGAGGVVKSGTLSLVTPESHKHRKTENYNGADVYAADFTGAPRGTYTLEISGLGQSAAFDIADEWVEEFATDLARFVTFQRSGIALNNLDGRDRPRNGHPDDGLVVHKSTVTLAGSSEGFTFPGETREESIKLLKAAYSADDPLSPKAFGGIHDAGDWDRRIQHMDIVYLIGTLLENFPTARAVNIGIPESGKVYAGTVADIGDGGDGTTVLPDLLHEALYITSLWRRTIGADGAVHGGVEYSNDGCVNSRSWNPIQRAFQYAPDPWSALLFVKGVGKLALVCDDPILARALTDEALLAWQWAQGNLTAKYLDTQKVMSAYVAAAAIVFRLTGEVSAKQIFEQHNAFKPSNGSTVVRRGDARYESLDYARADGADPVIAASIINWLDGQFDGYNPLAQDGSTISGQYPPGQGWKRFGPCTGWAAQHVAVQFLAKGEPITPARDLIAQSLWFAMGANPSGRSVVAGWGNYIQDMVHKDLEDHPNFAGQSCYGISGVDLSHWEKPKIEGAMYPADLNAWARYSRVIPSSAVVPCTEHGMKASHMELLFTAFALLEANA